MYVIATISKNSYAPEKIKEILEAGADILRYNFSHGTPAEMKEKVGTAKRVIKELGLEGKIKILADLPGDKIRLGDFPQKEYKVEAGAVVTFKTAHASDDPERFVPVDYPNIGALVRVGQRVSCGDGEIGFEVVDVLDDETLKAKAVNAWHIPALKAFTIGRGIDSLEHITPKTLAHIEHLKEIDPDWVAFSFVNSAKYLKRGKELLKKHGVKNTKIVSKIESQQGVDRIREIVSETDIVLIARGDLGLTTPIEKLGVYQKVIARATKEGGKELVVSTQILDSLLSYAVPSRAEVLDLTNAVLDGADGIMLCKETGISQTPGYSVAMAKRIIESVENSVQIR